jgi:hypothetical protein
MTPLDKFAREARLFCQWATGADGTAASVPAALIRVGALYNAALALPNPWTPGLSDQVADVELPDADLRLVAERAATLPCQLYWEIFDPLQDPPEEPVIGHTSDDIDDIYRDVAAGLVLFDSGRRDEAGWEWGFNFRTHWGEHATGALRAFHAYLAQEDPDGLSSMPDTSLERTREG